ncbi:MAG TPA: condensation domain-containing protein, partial [Candidatus Saccharimonadia bacterium]|nr:condensation domain-containing protein [Candidatus Saccharimonadia bacterium]
MEIQSYEPLTPLQLGMISDYVKDFQPGLDLLQVLCDTKEDLSPGAFAQAWNVAVNRHDLLRSRFLWEEVDVPVREVQGSAAVPFTEHDWRDLSVKEQTARFEKFLVEDRRAGMDLTKAPLMRLTLFRTGRKRWRWCWTCHHLLVDGRGLLLVLEEVFSVYESLRSGTPVAMPPAPAFSDYAAWHQRQDWSSAEKWWRGHLAGFTQPTPLLANHATEQTGDDTWAERRVDLSAKVTRRLGALAAKAGVTLNTVLQGAWALFLSRCSGEQEAVFGAVRACRKSNVPSAPSTAGLFVNTLPVRVRTDEDRELIPWLRELRNQWMALRDFENVPLSHVQGWSEVQPGTRLFDSILNYQEPSWDKALSSRRGVWRQRHFRLRCQPSYPLTLDIYGGGSSLALNMVYDRGRFSPDTVSRMMEYLQTLLESMAASDVKQRLGDLGILTKAARRQVVEKWNDTARRYPRNGIHELFEEQVKSTPNAVAATFGDESITYHKLNLRANRLGRHLR